MTKTNKPQQVFLAMYNPCIYESEHKVLSVHATQEGADKVVEREKARKLRFYQKGLPDYLDFKVEKFDLQP